MRSVEALFLDIVQAIERVQHLCAGLSRDEFVNSVIYSGYVIHELTIIGEASRQVPPETRKEHPSVAWNKIVGMRNFLVHEYFRLELETVWAIVEEELPPLLAYLQPLISSTSHDDETNPQD